MNVSLSNFTLNGNRGNGKDGDSTSGGSLGITNPDWTGNIWYFGINLMNLNNITIQNVVVINSPSYHIRLSNVGNVTVSGCLLRSFGLGTDGIHFDGPANDIAISNCSITSGDDGIALNCPEGYSGNISRVSVSNCTFSSWSLMRLDTIDS
jgi:polygalacturonase